MAVTYPRVPRNLILPKRVMICCKRVQIVQQMLCLWLYICLEQFHGLCASMLPFFILPWRVWAFSTYRIAGVSARKRVLSWAVFVRIMLKLWRCSLAVSLAAAPTAILAERINLNNVINGVSNLLEQDCVGVLSFTQVLEPRNPSGCLRPPLSKALLAVIIFNIHSLTTVPFLQTFGIIAAWGS